MKFSLVLPGKITGEYDLTGLDWPVNAKAGDTFYFYPERFRPESACPQLAETVYTVLSVGSELDLGNFWLVLG